VKAKIDTGAYSGALHCTKVTEVMKNGTKILQFSPFDHPEKVVMLEKYEVRPVKSSNGQTESRYFIRTRVTIQGQTYPIILSLADRSEMKSQMLIGRRFLKKHNFVVDVSTSA
jgi:hypothetical protein